VGCWWLYFSREAARVLEQAQGRDLGTALRWGFGHYVVFASAAAVGSGLAARVDHWTHHAEASGLLTGGAVTVPTAVLVAAIWLVQLRRHDPSARTSVPFGLAAVLVLLGTLPPLPELVAGAVVAALVMVEVRLAAAQGTAPDAQGSVASSSSR
jgi:low temperature requirement protein LtrA